ncbi:hypothetical protein CSW98_12485 [Vibrio sp. HA2012]|nr:hypothetical protein CSW98_12485 [Vibrio sp. HA2012]
MMGCENTFARQIKLSIGSLFGNVPKGDVVCFDLVHKNHLLCECDLYKNEIKSMFYWFFMIILVFLFGLY